MPLVVVAYDISHDRRRAKMFKMLRKFGVPVQESLFECHLEDADTRRLRSHIRKLTHPHDEVRIYTLCRSCAGKITNGDGTVIDEPPDVWVI